MKKSNNYQIWFLLIILSFIWGSSFILIKKGLQSFSPWQVGSLRIVISGLILLPHFLYNLKKLKARQIWYILLFALSEIGIPPYLFSLAQTKISSSSAGILNSLVPLFTLIIGIIFFKMKFKLFKLFGIIIGIIGAFLIIFSKSGTINMQSGNLYGLLIVIATMLYGFGGNIFKKYLNETNSFLISSSSFVFMSIPAFFFIIFSDLFEKSFNNPKVLESFLSIACLSVFGSAIGIYLLTILIKKSDALIASFVTYLIPIFALFWAIIDGETINLKHLIGLALILLSVFIINKKYKTI